MCNWKSEDNTEREVCDGRKSEFGRWGVIVTGVESNSESKREMLLVDWEVSTEKVALHLFVEFGSISKINEYSPTTGGGKWLNSSSKSPNPVVSSSEYEPPNLCSTFRIINNRSSSSFMRVMYGYRKLKTARTLNLGKVLQSLKATNSKSWGNSGTAVWKLSSDRNEFKTAEIWTKDLTTVSW
jgi:hypothetical protein